jgi:hypothetical protein
MVSASNTDGHIHVSLRDFDAKQEVSERLRKIVTISGASLGNLHLTLLSSTYFAGLSEPRDLITLEQ